MGPTQSPPGTAAAAGYLVRVETEPTRDFGSFVRDLFSALFRATDIAMSGVLDMQSADPVFVVVRDRRRRLIGLEGPFTAPADTQAAVDRLQQLLAKTSVEEVREHFRLP